MADKTGIEWTDATWNPIVGCSIVSPGCTNCYAMTMAGRIEAMGTAPHYRGTTKPSKAGAVWTGKLALAPEHILLQPLRWQKPRRIFVNSMGDLFHEDVPDEWIDRVFAVMALAPQHTFQILTKRAARMRAYLTRPAGDDIQDVRNHLAWDVSSQIMSLWAPEWRSESIQGKHRSRGIGAFSTWPLPNVWLGVSAEDQRRADKRVPDLLATPAAMRFVSAEPLLGPIDFTLLDINGDGEMDALKPRAWNEEIGSWRGSSPTWEEDFLDWFNLSSMPSSGNLHATLDWIIVGGESGTDARPMHPDWPRQIRDGCSAAGTAFFFKQWGEWAPSETATCQQGALAVLCRDGQLLRGQAMATGRLDDEHAELIAKFGKAKAGRLLDGAEHNAMPELRR
ncbi:phage Gp37/Gp68 family protein [Bosea lathyri]|uniref:Protein gp37 n=1 Tax=Bosea lathyri TaxID=1036778 RepID=A0A1H6BDV1_9HYPH|nr:phage Gp37/Gp68 family protein [Bosea lathyri]SEG58850.1 protein gp37 [Bosea lathyri]